MQANCIGQGTKSEISCCISFGPALASKTHSYHALLSWTLGWIQEHSLSLVFDKECIGSNGLGWKDNWSNSYFCWVPLQPWRPCIIHLVCFCFSGCRFVLLSWYWSFFQVSSFLSLEIFHPLIVQMCRVSWNAFVFMPFIMMGLKCSSHFQQLRSMPI